MIFARKGKVLEALGMSLRSNTQLNLLKAVATGEKQITSVRVMQDYKLGTSNNIIKNREILIKKDILQFSQGNFEWLDPVFLIWFLRFLV